MLSTKRSLMNKLDDDDHGLNCFKASDGQLTAYIAALKLPLVIARHWTHTDLACNGNLPLGVQSDYAKQNEVNELHEVDTLILLSLCLYSSSSKPIYTDDVVLKVNQARRALIFPSSTVLRRSSVRSAAP